MNLSTDPYHSHCFSNDISLEDTKLTPYARNWFHMSKVSCIFFQLLPQLHLLLHFVSTSF